jgi:hypothetical protein
MAHRAECFQRNDHAFGDWMRTSAFGVSTSLTAINRINTLPSATR